MVHIPPVDGDDLLTRKNIKLEKSQPNQKIDWASPKKHHHEKMDKSGKYKFSEIKEVELLPDSKIKKSKKKKKSSHSPRKSSQNSRKHRSISPHGNKNLFKSKSEDGSSGPPTKFFTRYGVSKPYELPLTKKQAKE